METMSETDSSLIAEFNARRSEAAFAALVRQHVHLVFATALRQVGDSGAAEEITQNVFVALAQAAGKLGAHPTIAGWLHQTALNKSREWLRSELRRRKREQAAVNLELAAADGNSVWSPLVPLLDEALLALREADRQAVILHYMEGRTFQEVGSALGLGEDAARKRVNRCLDQLAHFFRRRGFAVPAIAAGAPLFTLSFHAAPAGLAASATTAGLAAAQSAASTSTLTLIKGALKLMAWTKAKTIIAAGVTILFGIVATTVAIKKFDDLRGNIFWRNIEHFQSPSAMLADLNETPAQVTIIPAIYSHWGGITWFDKNGRMLGMNSTITNLLGTAYYELPSRIIFSQPPPAGKYDFIANFPSGSDEALRQKIKEQFGLVAQREVIDAQAWLLEVKDPAKLKTTSHVTARPSSRSGDGEWRIENEKIATLVDLLEGIFLRAPVIDRTGLSGRYDFDLHWNVHNQARWIPMLTNQLDQLGLELVPTNMPIEMLVVEKAK